MQPERFRVLVLVSGGLMSVSEAERILFPAVADGRTGRAVTALFWGALSVAVLVLMAGVLAEMGHWEVWRSLQLIFLPVNGPTLVRHLHAILSNLMGGLGWMRAGGKS